MSIGAKIHLSKYETEVVTDMKWILTKQAVIEKIYVFFGELHEVYKTVLTNSSRLPFELDLRKNGKISKGENYQGFPYVILDYPAVFKKDKIFAIRTMFWWGNFFSITLHISGWETMQSLNFANIFSQLKNGDFFVCINEDEWQHNFSNDNYIALNSMNEMQFNHVCSKNFFKVSKKIDLGKYDEIPNFLSDCFRELIEIINVSYPGGEKVP